MKCHSMRFPDVLQLFNVNLTNMVCLSIFVYTNSAICMVCLSLCLCDCVRPMILKIHSRKLHKIGHTNKQIPNTNIWKKFFIQQQIIIQLAVDSDAVGFAVLVLVEEVVVVVAVILVAVVVASKR